jgi:hypothetical protein
MLEAHAFDPLAKAIASSMLYDKRLFTSPGEGFPKEKPLPMFQYQE